MNRSIRLSTAAAAIAAATVGMSQLAPAHGVAAGATSGGEGYTGIVTADGLATRGMPTPHSAKYASLDKGQVIKNINCKVRSTNVKGNRLWYSVDTHDGTVWVAAKYIDNAGAAPQYCDPSDGSLPAKATAGVNQRQGPSAKDRNVGSFAKGATVQVQCFTRVGNNGWAHTARGNWVSVRHLKLHPQTAYCANH